ncbi:TRAP transporter, DctQ-like membrane domain protein [Bordetella bronchiseptica GA96-01]|nr:TRAP transporter, DctQ-like membrane domain protein [Bordetella bronchiseptica GA96-01]
MKALLALSRGIDALNLRVGRAVTWVTLLVVLVSAGNAVVRKVFHSSSNAWLELQWYMFGAMFLLTAGYTLLKNEHVRVDILSSRLPRHKQIWIEIFGVVFFLLAGVHPDHGSVVAGVHGFVPERRAVVELGRADPLAGQAVDSGGVCAAGAGGAVAPDQVHRVLARAVSGPDRARGQQERRGAAGRGDCPRSAGARGERARTT